MRLRSRLLTLIALLLSGALAASFLLIYSAVRRQAMNDLDGSLAVARGVWETLSKSQAQSLVASATGMAGEAGFVTVLRSTDRATLQDYLRDSQANNALLDLILVLDAEGRLRGSAPPQARPPQPEEPLLAAALQGEVGAAFWPGPEGLYLAAATPILRGGDQLDGVLLLGVRLDQDFVDQLARDTATQACLRPAAGGPIFSGGRSFEESRLRTVSSPLPAWNGREAGLLVLGRDLNASLSYMKAVGAQLAGLGLGVLALAFVVSVPLVGRVSNPVEQLAKTQAEMDAVFQANLDGLVALDQAGRVVSANPAAAVCLGMSAEALVGRRLEELLPAQVFSLLIAVPPASGQLVQRCEYEREGRFFLLTRTFVPSQHLEVGSVLVTRDLTHERGRGQGQARWLARLRETLGRKPRSDQDWQRWEKDHQNLCWLAGAELSSTPIRELPAELESLRQQLGLPLEWSADLPDLELSAEQLRLLLLNLSGAACLRLEREGGGCWLEAEAVEVSDWDLEAMQAVLTEVEGRLESEEGRLRLWLPARLQSPC